MKNKALNYRVGALKKKFGMGKKDFEPGELIAKAKESMLAPVAAPKKGLSKKEIAILGLI